MAAAPRAAEVPEVLDFQQAEQLATAGVQSLSLRGTFHLVFPVAFGMNVEGFVVTDVCFLRFVRSYVPAAVVESEQPDVSSQPPTSSQSDLDSELLQSGDPSFYRQLEFQDETTAARTAALQGGLLRVSGGALAPTAKPQREHKSSSRPPSSDTRRGERKKRDQLIVIDGPNVARVR